MGPLQSATPYLHFLYPHIFAVSLRTSELWRIACSGAARVCSRTNAATRLRYRVTHDIIQCFQRRSSRRTLDHIGRYYAGHRSDRNWNYCFCNTGYLGGRDCRLNRHRRDVIKDLNIDRRALARRYLYRNRAYRRTDRKWRTDREWRTERCHSPCYRKTTRRKRWQRISHDTVDSLQ